PLRLLAVVVACQRAAATTVSSDVQSYISSEAPTATVSTLGCYRCESLQCRWLRIGPGWRRRNRESSIIALHSSIFVNFGGSFVVGTGLCIVAAAFASSIVVAHCWRLLVLKECSYICIFMALWYGQLKK
ncbi:hypothetical protein ACHAWC_005564, partial [Mediolabrus comicus]